MTTTRTAKVALLEPYCKGSHAAWAQGYAAGSRLDVHLYTLPGIHWKWRMCHSHLTLAGRLAAAGPPPRALLCTSMVDLAGLRGLLPGDWPRLPAALYCHENQLTYPLAEGEERDLHFAWTQFLSCLAADLVIFNSRFHQEDFLAALPPFLASFPDQVPRQAPGEIASKCRVVTPGVDTAHFAQAAAEQPPRQGPLRILWNHRWEKDKEPALFLTILERLAGKEATFQVVLAGAGADRPGGELAALITRLGDRVVHQGTSPAGEYPGLVASCDLVVSTARHDFFGISTVEAMAAGLLPLLPRRQNYPYLVPAGEAGRCLYDSPDELLDRLYRLAGDPAEARRLGPAMQQAVADHDRHRTTAELDRLLSGLAGLKSPPGGGPTAPGGRG